jgi:hypothetical protein
MSSIIIQAPSSEVVLDKNQGKIEVPLLKSSIESEIQYSGALGGFAPSPTIEMQVSTYGIEVKKNDVTIIGGHPDITMNVSAAILSGGGDPNPYAFIPAGEDIPPYRVCHVVNGKAYLSSASMDPSLALSIKGVSVSSAVQDSVVQIQMGLAIQNPAWNFSIGGVVYLGENGEATQSIPSDGLLVEIGTAMSSSRLFLDVEEPISL